MNTKTTIAIFAAVAMLAAIVPSFMNSASAKITEQTTPTDCTTPSGNQIPGQEIECTGGGLTQEETTENVNPSGSAPPGQNK